MLILFCLNINITYGQGPGAKQGWQFVVKSGRTLSVVSVCVSVNSTYN